MIIHLRIKWEGYYQTNQYFYNKNDTKSYQRQKYLQYSEPDYHLKYMIEYIMIHKH